MIKWFDTKKCRTSYANLIPISFLAPGHFSSASAIKLLLPKHRPSWETCFKFLQVLTNEFDCFKFIFLFPSFVLIHSRQEKMRRESRESSCKSLPLLDGFGISAAAVVLVVVRRTSSSLLLLLLLAARNHLSVPQVSLCIASGTNINTHNTVHSQLSEMISLWHQTSNSMGPEWSDSAPTERMTETCDQSGVLFGCSLWVFHHSLWLFSAYTVFF